MMTAKRPAKAKALTIINAFSLCRALCLYYDSFSQSLRQPRSLPFRGWRSSAWCTAGRGG